MRSLARLGVTGVAVITAGVLTSACAARPAPTPAPEGSAAPTRSAAASLAAVPGPDPVPTVVPRPARSGIPPAEDSLPTSSSTERDGIRLTLSVGANPLYAGSTSRFAVTIENLGDETLHWTNDGCDVNALVLGQASGRWTDSALAVPDALAPYRDWLREAALVDQPIGLVARTAFRSDSRNSGCADVGLSRSLAPGDSVTQRLAWDGQSTGRLGLPPSGPATWHATFERWWRGETEEAEQSPGDPLVGVLETEIVGGRRSDALSAAQVIDAALMDERLASWLVTRPLRSGADAIAEYDLQSGLWIVGLLTYDGLDYGDPAEGTLHAAFVDPITGDVVAVRELPAQH